MQGDRAVAAIAARRHGVVVQGELLRAGLGRGAVAHRVATGRLTRLHRGVFLVGPLPGEWTREVAAVLAIGPDAALSHRSAAALWGVRPRGDGPVDVIAARKARLRPGIRVHRTARLPADDVWERRGIRVTSPVRTLLDLATVLPRLELERAVEQAEILRLLTRTQLEPRARGLLRRILADAHEPAFTRSEAEARLLALIRKARLPAPETNVRIGGYEVDFVWREQKLVVEVDGFAYHSTREAFERDRRKDADLQALGLRTTRVTFRQIATEPEATIARLSAMLAVQ
jgi:very-short-patch-repair endonuclease